MIFSPDWARRAMVLLLILTLANLFSSWRTSQTVHRLEATVNAQVDAAAKAAGASDKAADAAKQTATAVQSTAQSAKAAATTINQAAQSLCASSRVDCTIEPRPPLMNGTLPAAAASPKP